MNDQETGILSQGDVLNNTYVISDLVAQGGTGEVYRAMNRVSGREIAIKILKREFAQNEQFIDLMKREASVLHEVIDPAVVRYYDLLESDMHGGFLFIVMEFINGQSLADEMKVKGPLDAGILVKVAERVLQGLVAAHGKNAFHRDLSPDNIILRDGDPRQATLIDFGIAKDVNEGAKTVVGGGFAGKYQYASPEQMEGRVDARSDLYSLGMTLLGAFRGQAPLQGSSMMEIVKAKAEKPNISDMSGPLHDLVSRLVEPDPADRLQSAEEALHFLHAADGGAAEAAAPAPEATVVMPRTQTPAAATAAPGTPPQAKPKTETGKSRGGLWAALVLVLLLGGGGAAYFSGALDGLIGGDPVVTGDTGGDLPTAGDSPTTTDTATGGDTTTADTSDLPLAEPYRLSIERTSRSDPVRIVGNMPSTDLVPTVTKELEEALDTFAVMSDVAVARGEPFNGWAQKIAEIAKLFAAFESFRISAENNEVVLIAQAENEAEKTALLGATWQVIEGTGLDLIDRITITPPELTLAMVRAGMDTLENCGALEVSGGTGGVIGPTDTITVAGQVATAADRTKVASFLRQIAPGRTLNTQTQVVNPGVCNVLSLVPAGPGSALSIDYGYGTKEGRVPQDTFHMGENPVIDIVLPANRTGFLHVAFVDLAEQVFHLLPHQARTAHKLSDIGTVENAQRSIRVAFPISEASIENLGFKVVEPLGTNVVLAIVTDEPLFDALRPRAESNAAFVAALNGRLAKVVENGGLLTWRFLRTEP